MRLIVILAQLSLWIATTDAFFPWIPAYRCEQDGDCTAAQRRQLDPSASQLPEEALEAARAAKIPSFQIGQRISRSQPDSPATDRVAREANRMSRKYARYRPSQSHSPRPEERSPLLKRANQYTVARPAATTQKNSAGIFQDGTDFSYFVQVKLGSKEKPLYMLVDTGAGTTWVMGSACKSTACGLHDSFGPGDSDTYEQTPDSFRVAYGSGSVQGSKVKDSFGLADMKFRMQFGVANDTSADFEHFPFDGILGLSMAGGETQNFMQAVKGSSQIKPNIFCVSLSRSSDGPNTGEISFGGCNPAKYTGEISYTPVGAAGGDWAIPLDGLSYDGKKAGVKGKLAFIDTGTSYVFGPRDDVAAFHKTIPGSTTADGTTYKVPCDSNKDVAFSFSGVSYVVSPKDWRSAPGSDGLCTSNIYGHEVVPGAWLLGDLFLKNVYAVFDMDQSRIGFANRAALPPVPAPAPTTLLSSTTTQPASGSSPSNTQVQSLSTVSTPAPDNAPPSTKPSLGLSGHETSAGTAAAQTSPPPSAATGTQSSSGDQMQIRGCISVVLCVVAIVGVY